MLNTVQGLSYLLLHMVRRPLQEGAARAILHTDPSGKVRQLFGKVLETPLFFRAVNEAVDLTAPLAAHSLIAWWSRDSATVASIGAKVAISFFLGKVEDYLLLGGIPMIAAGIKSQVAKSANQTAEIKKKLAELEEQTDKVIGRPSLRQLRSALQRSPNKYLSVISGIPAYGHAALVAGASCVSRLALGVLAMPFIPIEGFSTVKENFAEAWSDLKGVGLSLAGTLYPLQLDPIVERFLWQTKLSRLATTSASRLQ